jgi:eukaryotic-like serine/threonine-protein kinase
VIEIGGTLKDRFLLRKELGRGGMGAVYSATDQVLQRQVAIKVLKEHSGEEVGKSLRLEAQIAARLLHDNVVRIYDFDRTEAAYFLVMEEVDGTSYSKRWRHLTLTERLRILAQVAEALDYAHHQGVVHRDIKPANVLVTLADVPKLSDFGLSIVTEQGDHSGMVRGTPHYMSPEQTRGSRLDFRTDLYSLGVMIYESATGGVPFTGTSLAIMSQHLSVQPDRPRMRNAQLSEELDSLISALLAKRSDERPRSGSVVAQALYQEIERIKERERAPTRTAVVNPGLASTADMKAPSATDPQPWTSVQGVNGPVLAPAPSTSVATPPVYAARTDGGAASTSWVAPSRPGSVVALPAAVATVASTGGITALVRSSLARRMFEVVLAEPILLSPDERYLHGHYLAYLLGGSRRRGLLMRRPMEPRNADRGRLLLAHTYTILAGGTDAAIADAAALLDQRIEVRAALSPIVSAKYLACRSTPARRKVFRQTRTAITEKSVYAQKKMLDVKGVLNPGLMPQKLENLQLLAPPRDAVDDVLVERWNRVVEVWRSETEFRDAVLRYATSGAHKDAASASLWPEVVYPLIERARWHRRVRSRTESAWDYIWGGMLHLPDAGVVLDRAIKRVVPPKMVAQLDESLNFVFDNPRLDDETGDPFAPPLDQADRLANSISGGNPIINLVDLAQEEREGPALTRLADPDPIRFLQSDLHELWKEALLALQNQVRVGAKPASHRHVPVGPYQLTVIPSVRGHTAGQIAIQGMSNKQIEISTPTVRTKGSAGKALLAIWVYCDSSLAIIHLDFMSSPRYVLWHAPKAHHLIFDDAADLNHELFSLGMEVPDQLDKVLSRWFKPKKNA